MAAEFSKTQVDQLGHRLRGGSRKDDDLIRLDAYRRSFREPYERVVQLIRNELHLDPTGRPAKSTSSVIEKLNRESIRLSQMQDIAGCRIVVEDVLTQDQVVTSLGIAFPGSSIVDRRLQPSYGYRAVHVIPKVFGKPIEIQVRSSLQHLWAELSEKMSDFDPTIKYGGGGQAIRNLLTDTSRAVAGYETREMVMYSGQTRPQDQQGLERDKEMLRKAFDGILSVLDNARKNR